MYNNNTSFINLSEQDQAFLEKQSHRENTTTAFKNNINIFYKYLSGINLTEEEFLNFSIPEIVDIIRRFLVSVRRKGAYILRQDKQSQIRE